MPAPNTASVRSCSPILGRPIDRPSFRSALFEAGISSTTLADISSLTIRVAAMSDTERRLANSARLTPGFD